MKTRISLLLLSYSCSIFGQAVSNPHQFAAHAQVAETASNIVQITADSPRPLNQALTAVRREYGWTVDYEDPVYSNAASRSDLSLQGALVGGSFTASLKKPGSSSLDEERTFLQNLVQQKNDKLTAHRFKVIQSGPKRFDVVPDERNQANPLDTPVQVAATNRSVGQIIDSILSAVGQTTGVKIVRGGLLDPDIELTKTSLSTVSPQPARTLLNQVLASTRSQMSWLMAYEPPDKTFYIGFQPTVKVVQKINGQKGELIVPN